MKKVFLCLALIICLLFLASIRIVSITSGNDLERYLLVYADESYELTDDDHYRIVSHSYSIEYQTPTIRFIPIAAKVNGTICFEDTAPSSFSFRGRRYDSGELFLSEPIEMTDLPFSYEYRDVSGWVLCVIPFFLTE